MLKRIDLHFHSNYSDGTLSVEEVLKLVARSNVGLAALTDHDTIKGVLEARKVADELGISLLSGVEISTMYKDGEVHILGYDFDAEDEEFNSFLNQRFKARKDKVTKIIDKLNAMKYRITFDDVLSQSPGPFVGRLNVAKALVKKGYIQNVKEAFTPQLIGDKGAAYVAPSGLSPKEAIERIHKAGGIAVVAHPGLYKNPHQYGLKEEDVLQMMEWGVDGLEAYHSKHTYSVSKYYHKLATIHGLIVTIGSDYHYGIYPIEFMSVPREVTFELTKLFERRQGQRVKKV
jgi:predicted metal-dependent phosphoesterase TrpH